eukprot:SAG31_NODE_12959_length_904_cov_1.048447_1_plen_20_part_10
MGVWFVLLEKLDAIADFLMH